MNRESLKEILAEIAETDPFEKIFFLLEIGAIFRAKDNHVIHLAAIKNRPEIVDILLHVAADVYTEIKYIAYIDADAEVQPDSHSEEDDEYLAQVIAWGLEEAFVRAVKESQIETVQALLESGANVDSKDEYGDTLLIAAIKGENCDSSRAETSDHLEIAKLLIKAGADTKAGNNYVICQATRKGYTEIVELLMQTGDDFSASGSEALCEAVESGHADIVQILLQAGVDVRSNNETLLCAAAANGHTEIVRMLLRSGADLHANFYNNPLYFAIENGHTKTVQLLLEAGISSNYLTKVGIKKHITPGFILSSGEELIDEIEKSRKVLGEEYRWSQNKRVLKSIEEENNFEARIALFDLYYRPGEPAYYQAVIF